MEKELNNKIMALSQLYVEFDKLNEECSESCAACKDLDCAGYIWLLEKEIDPLIENGIGIIQADDNVYFINSFQKKNGDIDLTKRFPKCAYRCKKTKRCLIHQCRPLTCHMYPIGFDTVGGKDVFICSLECEFVRYLIKNNKFDDYANKAKNIIERIDKKLYKEIVNAYRDMNAMMDNYEVPNDKYKIIKEM